MVMDVPEGYKLTEVGVIPEDWKVKKLKEISPRVSVGLVINPSSYFDKQATIPMLVGSHIDENIITWENANCISEDSNSRLGASRLRAGDLVTVRVGEPGVTAVIPDALDNCNCASVMITRKSHEFDSTWLCFMMNSRLGRLQIEGVQYGTAQKQFNIIDAIDFSYPFPHKKEQTAIATTLSDVDTLITTLTTLIEKKRQIKTATMQRLLTGKQRLPGFGEGKGMQQTELGEIPEDWEVKSVFEVADKDKKLFDDGDWVEAEHITDKGIRLVQTGNIGLGQFLERAAKKYIYEVSFEQLKCKELIEGDILICRLADPAGRACIFPNIAEEKVITSVDVTVFRPDVNKADRNYLVNYFSSASWFKAINLNVGGTTHQRISRGALGKILIPIPSIQEQSAIAQVLNALSHDITTLENRLSKTKSLKQGMMQELLTGRTRLVKPEKQQGAQP